MIERLDRCVRDCALPLLMDDFALNSYYSTSSNVVASGIVRDVPRGRRFGSRRVRVRFLSHRLDCILPRQNGPDSWFLILRHIFG